MRYRKQLGWRDWWAGIPSMFSEPAPPNRHLRTGTSSLPLPGSAYPGRQLSTLRGGLS